MSQMGMVKRNFSDMLRHSGQVVELTEQGQDVLLERRDGADLMLVEAERETGMRESLRTAAAFLLAALETEPSRQLVSERASDRVPWLRLLPEEYHAEFLREYAEVVEAAVHTGAFAAVSQLERNWMTTARLYGDPGSRSWLIEPVEVDQAYGLKRLQETVPPTGDTAPAGRRARASRSRQA